MVDESTPASASSETVAELRDNPTFAAALIGGDKAAQARWADAHARAASGGAAPTSPPPATARPTPDALRGDADFEKRLTDPFHSGHRDAQKAWAEAHGAELSKADPFAAPESLAERLEAADLPPASADRYELPQPPQGLAPLHPDDATEWRNLALAAELPQADFSFITQAAYSEAPQPAEAWSQLIARHGAEAADRIVDKARSVIDGLAPDVKVKALEWAAASGMGDHPAVLERLALLADRRAVRTKGKP